MTKILSLALGAAAVTGIATLALAAPRQDPTPLGLVGNTFDVIGLPAQNLNGNGHVHSPGVGTTRWLLTLLP
ncbi:hypothetical protein [Streptomyces sp. Ru62]|uniref:hypothetical protein n=1 Tax=Streptomyces sp. Ru62 TaxID=2080745 RepID=UPI0011B08760|nr:hypothetical protein [Streptomyces sp. Ru62]